MRIVVGLSGGVDSACAAALLQERGCDVLGVYLKFDDGSATCPSREDIASARRIAAHLDIPLMVHDVSLSYEELVLAPMVRAYAAGATPNPDTACNRWVKFTELLRIARRTGADAIATGHYARARRRARGRRELLRAADTEKDQSYFLWELTREQLDAAVFPIGAYTKAHVRAMARARGLPNWDRRSTRGICFLGKTDLPTYLAHRSTAQPATLITADGAAIGSVVMGQAYTIGQRVRLAGQRAPRFVVARDPVAQTITVSDDRDDASRWHTRITAHGANWIGGIPSRGFTCSARIRHRHEPQPCAVTVLPGQIAIHFERPQFGVAPGQAIVFNDGDRVLGGATITASW